MTKKVISDQLVSELVSQIDPKKLIRRNIGSKFFEKTTIKLSLIKILSIT